MAFLESFLNAAVGKPAMLGAVGLVVAYYMSRRPYIAIAGAVIGMLIGMGI